MKHIRRFNESKESIEAICQKYNITNYTINEDGSIDVDGSVNLINKGLTKLPIKFRNVTGSFDCRNNKLVSLEGAPKSLDYSFNCSFNKLTSLEGAPKLVGGSFYCTNNQLTTLEGAPKYVDGNFHCSYNKLTTLEGAPKSVGEDFYCNNNQLVNLDFAPSCQSIYCGNNPIHKWWSKIDISKLDAFIDLGIDARDPDFMNQEKIDLLLE